jgi:phytol kinase
MSDLLAIGISFVYVFAVLAIAETLRKLFHLPVEFTRKVVHISVGMWSFGTVALFTDKWLACVTPASFIVLNYISYKRGLFLAMESNDRSNLGTVYFPIAFCAIILLTWDISKPMLVASLMPMTWGDAFAAIIGKRFGTRRYTIAGATRSFEGSLAMFAFSFVAVFLALVILEGLAGPALPGWAALFALVTALAATAAEAVSVRGLDNIFVPAVSWTALMILTRVYATTL